MTNERSVLHRSPSNHPHLNMPWTTAEHSPNTFTRPLGPNEVFIKLLSDPGHPLGREHWAVN